MQSNPSAWSAVGALGSELVTRPESLSKCAQITLSPTASDYEDLCAAFFWPKCSHQSVRMKAKPRRLPTGQANFGDQFRGDG